MIIEFSQVTHSSLLCFQFDVDILVKKENIMVEENKVSLEKVKLSEISPHPKNVNRVYTGEAFEEMVRSIENRGILQPPALRMIDENRYETIFGHRRIAGAKKLNQSDVLAFVFDKDVSNAEVISMMVAENVNREDPCELETAKLVEALSLEKKVSFAEAGESLGFSNDRCSNYKKLLGAPDFIKKLSEEGVTNDLRGLSDMARAVENNPKLESVMSLLAENGVSGRKIAKAARDMGEGGEAKELVERLGLDIGGGALEKLDGLGSNELYEAGKLSAAVPLFGGTEAGAEVAEIKTGGTAKPKAVNKKKTDDDEDKPSRIRAISEISLEPILVVYKEKKTKSGKGYTPAPLEHVLIKIVTGKQSLEFKLEHLKAQAFMAEAEALRKKIANGEEGQRRRIECSAPTAKSKGDDD